MGMPGSETALEELMCRVLGDLLQEGVVVILADDLYCGGNFPEELLQNWTKVLGALHKKNLRLPAAKTVVNPKTTTILGTVPDEISVPPTDVNYPTVAPPDVTQPEMILPMMQPVGEVPLGQDTANENGFLRRSSRPRRRPRYLDDFDTDF